MADVPTAAELRRLYAEEVPTGRFGGPHTPPPRLSEKLPPTTPEAAAAHRAVLAATRCPRKGGARV